MPGPVAWFAENQPVPVTAVVDTLRAMFAQQPVGSGIWITLALAWLVGILAVAYAIANSIYRRRIS